MSKLGNSGTSRVSAACLALWLMALPAACRHGGEEQDPYSPDRVAAVKQNLRYHKVIVHPFVVAPGVEEPGTAASVCHGATLDFLRQKNIFTSVEAGSGPAPDAETLVIDGTIDSLRIVGGGARFWGGAMAGSSHMNVVVIAKDSTDRQVGTKAVNNENSAWGGAWTGGATDRGLPADMGQFVADAIIQMAQGPGGSPAEAVAAASAAPAAAAAPPGAPAPVVPVAATQPPIAAPPAAARPATPSPPPATGSRPAPGSGDAEAAKKIEEVMNGHFTAGRHAQAEQELIGAQLACSDSCTPQMMARIWMHVGVVRGVGLKKQANSLQAFKLGLNLDREAAPPALYMDAATQRSYLTARKEAGLATAPKAAPPQPKAPPAPPPPPPPKAAPPPPPPPAAPPPPPPPPKAAPTPPKPSTPNYGGRL